MRRWLNLVLSIALAAFAADRALAQAAAVPLPAGVVAGPAVEGVSEYRLANGLRVLLIPDPSVDTITTNMTYLVGSRHEGYGEAGMAHLLEHMLFKSTPSHPNIKSALTARGARYNGTTSYDRTNYFQTFPASRDNLAWSAALEAERMTRATFTKADLDGEMTVVRNEFESRDNSPFNVLRERVFATAYAWHNYGRAIIGTRSDIENVPIDRLRAFYEHYYQPDNAVFVIAGRFDPAAALADVARAFADVPRATRTLRTTYTVEPTQDGERQVILRRVGDVQAIAVSYHVPPGNHPDYPAIDLLVATLNAQPSGRLHKALIETGKAAFVFGSERQQPEAGTAYFGASVRRDQPIEPVREILLDVLEGFTKSPVTQAEVDRARQTIVGEYERALNDSRTLALTLSETIALGDWRLLYWYRDQFARVTPADVQRVALAYLKPANRTLGIFVPTDKPDRAEIPAPPDVAKLLAGYTGRAAVAQGEAFDPSPANIESRVIRRTLPGGIKLAMLPKKTRGEQVVATLTLRWADEESKAGRSMACSVAGAMLTRGTTERNRAQIRDELTRLKATVTAGIEGGTIDTIRPSFEPALRLMAEMLRKPAFPQSEFEQLRAQSLASLESQRSDPASLASLQMTRHLNPWPKEHWLYTPTLDERAERLRDVKLADAERCYRELVGASNAEMAIVGDFDPEATAKLVAELLGDWKSPRPYKRIEARYFETPALDRVILTPDKSNAVYRAGLNIQLRDDDPDFPALILGNYLLGGASDARLPLRIREKEGLSYSVSSWLTGGQIDRVGEFGVSAIYAPQNRARVEAAVREEIARVLDQGFTADEVSRGARAVLEARRVARSQDANLAARLSSYLFVDRTMEWDTRFEARIAALTPAEVRDALRRRLARLGELSIVRAGDFERAGQATAQAPGAAPAPARP